MGWAQQEFETIDLGDPRLNRRAVLLAERLGQKPRASIAGGDEAAAAYRFLRNEQANHMNVGIDHDTTEFSVLSPSEILCVSATIPAKEFYVSQSQSRCERQ